jgi:hypothetical protein
MRLLVVTCIMVFVLLACEREDIQPEVFDKTTGVFILNEGNFTYGNASLSFLDLITGELENQVFYKANSFPLGDVAYSMTLMDTTAFISMNNSGKIFSINTNSFKHLGTLPGLVSPRYIHIVNADKGYISDLYSPAMVQFNPTTMQKTDSVFVGRNTEQIIEYQNHLFVNSWSFGDEVFKISLETNKVVGSVKVNKQPNSMVLDENNLLWVLSDGGFEGSQFGVDYPALARIDPETLEIAATLIFPSKSGSPNNLLTNGTKDSVFFLYGSWAGESGFEPGIYCMSVYDTSLPENPLIREQNRRFYRMGVDPVNSTIYVSDARDYLQRGYVFRFRPDGELIDSLQADRIPGFFTFKKN